MACIFKRKEKKTDEPLKPGEYSDRDIIMKITKAFQQITPENNWLIESHESSNGGNSHE